MQNIFLGSISEMSHKIRKYHLAFSAFQHIKESKIRNVSPRFSSIKTNFNGNMIQHNNEKAQNFDCSSEFVYDRSPLDSNKCVQYLFELQD